MDTRPVELPRVLEGNVARIFRKGSFGRDDLLREVRSLVGSRSPAADASSSSS